jgi:hypothetical protein
MIKALTKFGLFCAQWLTGEKTEPVTVRVPLEWIKALCGSKKQAWFACL